MSYTLTSTGLNRTTMLRAIKTGKISGAKDEYGEWHIEPAELHRVYAGRGIAAGCYAGGASFRLLLGFLRDCDSRSSGLAMPAIMPVATRV